MSFVPPPFVSRRMISFGALFVFSSLCTLMHGSNGFYCPGELFAAEKGAPASKKSVPPVTAKRATAGAAKKYLGKEYIDSTILGAIYLISDAASTAGVGFRQREAIAEARRIAERLKIEYRGDPNERYVQWKVNELEWLIFIEEKDLVLEKTKQGQASANQLVADYNTAVAKPRPDFRKLTRLHVQMAEISPTQADEMANSIAKRSKVVSRESMVALEKALMNSDVALANETFRYCLSNRNYLAFSPAKFEQLEARMSACARSREEFPEIKKEVARAEQLLARMRLGETRSVLQVANWRLNDIRSYIPERDGAPVALALMRLSKDLGGCEDSLVRENISILRTKGVDNANRYLQSVLRAAGVSNEKMAGVDQMILAVSTPSENTKMQKEINAVASSAESGGNADVFGDMRAKAIKKAQQKQDSINAVAAKIAAEEAQKNRDHAMRVASEIYGLIERNKPRVAFDFFYNKKPFLQKSLTRDAYAMLEGTVQQVVDPEWVTDGSDEIAYLTPVAEKAKSPVAAASPRANPSEEINGKATEIIAKVYEALERNDVKSAFQRFEKERAFLKANLDPDAYTILNETLSSAYQSVR